MKRIFHVTMALVTLLAISTLPSCAWLKERRANFSNEKKEAETVPKAQYDQLLSKYEALLKKQRGPHKANQEQTPVAESSATEKVDLVDELKSSSPDLEATVDAFPKKTKVSAPMAAASEQESYDAKLVGDQIRQLKQATQFLAQNKHDASLKILRGLESSPVPQIRVHAKFNIGELLFKQGEWDLAMQVFEGILKQYAFSGLVIKTLGRLIICTEKLKLGKKKERYFSVLNDFFGGNS